MPKTIIEAEPETVTDVEPEDKTNSRKREITAAAIATTVTVLLGLAANGAIGKLGETVKNRIAPPPEKKTDS